MAGLALVACSSTERDDRFGSGGTDNADEGGLHTEGEAGNDGNDGNDGAESGAKFDTPNGGDGGIGDCDCGNFDWSYIWFANTEEATVSKLNTRTMQEEGRYRTGGFEPSRTSVSIDGKAAVVANRGGGMAKYWTKSEFCDPMANGQGGLQTSTGSKALAWQEDDCLDWYVEFPDATAQRPVAWTSGHYDMSSCKYEDQKVWTVVGYNGKPGWCNGGDVTVYRLDGDSGNIDDAIDIPQSEFPCVASWGGETRGPYGGAVDYQGNFWFHGHSNGKLVRIDFETLDYEIFEAIGYGITVDTQGRVWLSNSEGGGISRFDYSTKQWATANPGCQTSGGVAQDHQGRIWAAFSFNGLVSCNKPAGIVWVDMESMAVGDVVGLPDPGVALGAVKGVSVDIDGSVWANWQWDPVAYKIDPDTYGLETFSGLNKPYTYSDMTGGQINNVTCNPPEG